MTALSIAALLSDYDAEQEPDAYEVGDLDLTALGIRSMTRAHIEEDFNVNQAYIVRELGYTPYL